MEESPWNSKYCLLRIYLRNYVSAQWYSCPGTHSFHYNNINFLVNKHLMVKDLHSTRKIKIIGQPFLEASIYFSLLPPINENSRIFHKFSIKSIKRSILERIHERHTQRLRLLVQYMRNRVPSDGFNSSLVKITRKKKMFGSNLKSHIWFLQVLNSNKFSTWFWCFWKRLLIHFVKVSLRFSGFSFFFFYPIHFIKSNAFFISSSSYGRQAINEKECLTLSYYYFSPWFHCFW